MRNYRFFWRKHIDLANFLTVICGTELFYLTKYRINSSDVFRRINAHARKYLFDDLREKGGLAFDEISSLVALGQHAQPNVEASSAREKDARFTLGDIPKP